jgi:hypothetical protein
MWKYVASAQQTMVSTQRKGSRIETRTKCLSIETKPSVIGFITNRVSDVNNNYYYPLLEITAFLKPERWTFSNSERHNPLKPKESRASIQNLINQVATLVCNAHACVGRDSSVGTATRHGAGRSGDGIPVRARFSAAVQTGPGAHQASCTISTGSRSWG